MQKWYDNEVSKGIFKNKYFHQGETSPEQVIDRVSSIFSKELSQRFHEAFSAGDICPSGRTIYCAGAKGKYKVSPSSCFIVPEPEDNIESIYKVNYELGRIFSYGGGVGINVSKLRPRGAKVNNAARTSTGAVSFLKLFDATGETISQNGRRGAIMVGLDCSHPDIYEFLHIKQNNEKLASMNISILFTDEFMEAVEKDADYTLKFIVKDTGEVIEHTIRAKEFFKEYCETQWDWGDPGALFIDKLRNYNLLSGYKDYRIDISNPCVTGQTLILTDSGYKRIDSLVGEPVQVWNGYKWSKVVPEITGHNQKMLRVTLSNGMSLDCTLYHKFIMSDESREEAQNLSVGNKLAQWEYPVIEPQNPIEERFDAYTAGFFAGSGSDALGGIILSEYEKNLFTPHLDCSNMRKQGIFYVAELNNKPTDKCFVPSASHSKEFRLRWLAGFLDSCAGISDDGSVSVININEAFLRNVQLMLTTLGCHSKLSPSKPMTNKESYISELDLSPFAINQLIKLGISTVKLKFSGHPNAKQEEIHIVSIDKIADEETVYCFNEPMNHSGLFNGVITAQCGEFAGNAYNSCNLLSINLYNMIDDKFENPKLNIEKLKATVQVGINALDEILDYGYEMQPLNENRTCIDDWRSVGLGVLGLADALVAMKLRYGSKEANEFVSNVMKEIFFEAIKENALMAKEKGNFKKYNFKNTDKSPLIQMVKKEAPETYQLIKEYGLRNGTLLAVAPTGTISLVLGALSGGCEPIYQIAYERTSHKMEDEGKTFRVYAKSVRELLDYHKLPDLSREEIKKKFPWIIESHDVPFMERVAMQSAMQPYVDNSISSTVNLRTEATPDDIFKIYMQAWKSGCKGITVFRDQCKRGNILGVKKDAKDTPTEIKYDSILPKKREKVPFVHGFTMVRKTACVEKMYITVNYTQDGDIFEIFTNPSGGCQSNIATMTRLASYALRCGGSVEGIIKQMSMVQCAACQTLIRKGEKGISLSCGTAIASALKEAYGTIKKQKEQGETLAKGDRAEIDTNLDGNNPAINAKCPECDHYTLKPDGKCVTCTRCGWSRCD